LRMLLQVSHLCMPGTITDPSRYLEELRRQRQVDLTCGSQVLRGRGRPDRHHIARFRQSFRQGSPMTGYCIKWNSTEYDRMPLNGSSNSWPTELSP
jgi:hypothetical protein